MLTHSIGSDPAPMSSRNASSRERGPGSIILSHDIHPPTIAAMSQVFDALLAKGFKFVTVSELLAMDKGGERPEVAKTPQARLSPRGHVVPPSATVPEVQPAQSPATATSPP